MLTKILVVEDEPIVALNLQERLVKLGYAVSGVASSSEQALQSVNDECPDMILMDIHIEGPVDGITTAAKISEHSQTPIVYLTAYSEEATLQRARATKPYGYLLKPFSERELHATIQMALERHQIELRLQQALRDIETMNATLELKVEDRTRKINLNERISRLQRDLALQAEASMTVDDLLLSALQTLTHFGEWSWGYAYRCGPYRNEYVGATDDANDSLSTLLSDKKTTPDQLGPLLTRRNQPWLNADELAEAAALGNLPARPSTGYRLQIGAQDQLLGVLIFLRTEINKSDDNWSALVTQVAVELGLFVERKTAQEKLRTLSSAIEHSSASIMITDASGCTEYTNPYFTSASQYTSADILGRNPRILKSGKMPAEIYKDLWEMLAHGLVWRGEFLNLKKNGEEFWESASIAPVMDSRGKITHFVAVKQDITKQKLIENELRVAKQVAESATAAKSLFLANMSHEIRTPLNAILGLCYLLQNTDSPDLQSDYIKKANASAQFLLGMLNNLLDLSKIESGKLTLEEVDFCLSDSLNDVITILSVNAGLKKLNVHLNYDPNLPKYLRGDALRLQQVLMNIGANAIKFSETDDVVISVNLVNMEAGHAQLRFSVLDHGVGIPAEQITRIFDPFVQADASTTRRFGGSGLGLAICHHLVALMGGDLHVISSPGKGSEFYFTVGFNTVHASVDSFSRSDTMLEKRNILAGVKVLVVDDNLLNLQIARSILELGGAVVETVGDGQLAVNCVQEKGNDFYDLILMDVQMPGMDGCEATRAIRSLAGSPSLPILAMSAGAGAEDREHCLAAGMNDFVMKPINVRLLFSAMALWLVKPNLRNS